MKRLKKLIHGLSFSLSACSLADLAQAAETWDMPTPYPDKTFHTQNIMFFADEVRQATCGPW